MSESLLSYTKEDYLRAISLIGQKRPAVRVTDVAGYLHLSKSTVSERLKELAELGFIKFQKYSDIILTPVGTRIVRKLTHRHRVIEVFLYEILGVPKAKLHEETDRLEHGFSDDTLRRLDKFLGYPKFDPHGKTIKK